MPKGTTKKKNQPSKTKPKVRRIREIIKIRAELNETKKKKKDQ